MQKQKGFIQIILIALIVLIVAGAGVYYYITVNKANNEAMPMNANVAPEYQTDYQAAAQNAPAITSVKDLDKATSDLDNTDLTQIDKELSGLASDSSSF